MQGMGLATSRYYGRLMPLLLPWCCAPDAQTQLQALQLLHLVVRQTWPRVAVHAAVLQEALEAAQDEFESRGDRHENALSSGISEQLEEVQHMVHSCRQACVTKVSAASQT